MNLQDFFRRFLVHMALAASVAYLVVLAIERLIPGFAAPFVDIPGLGLLVIALLVAATIAFRSSYSRVYCVCSILLCAVPLTAACLFLWSRVNDFGSKGLLLMAVAVTLSMLGLFAFWGGYDTTE